jgi:hypothetical protein
MRAVAEGMGAGAALELDPQAAKASVLHKKQRRFMMSS